MRVSHQHAAEPICRICPFCQPRLAQRPACKDMARVYSLRILRIYQYVLEVHTLGDTQKKQRFHLKLARPQAEQTNSWQKNAGVSKPNRVGQRKELGTKPRNLVLFFRTEKELLTRLHGTLFAQLERGLQVVMKWGTAETQDLAMQGIKFTAQTCIKST